MIVVEVETGAFYDYEASSEGAPDAVELPTGGWVVRKKVKKSTTQHFAVREEGLQMMIDNKKIAGQDWTIERCLIMQIEAAAPAYSDVGDWVDLTCSDPRLETVLKTYFGLPRKKEKK